MKNTKRRGKKRKDSNEQHFQTLIKMKLTQLDNYKIIFKKFFEIMNNHKTNSKSNKKTLKKQKRDNRNFKKKLTQRKFLYILAKTNQTQ